jgi:CDP-diacylglycerol--serine O-phosphatidyltransferase
LAERRNAKKSARGTAARSRFRSGLTILPNLFTIGNIFCGYYSIMATIKGNYDYAAIAIGLGAVLDTMDGRIARLTKTTSDFGVQLDSLADFFTFGVAPAVLAFNWGLASIAGNISRHVIQLGWISTFAFTICSAMRLARFNIQSQKPPETTSKRYFVGLPTPASAGLVAAVVHYFKTPILLVGSAVLWSLLMLAAAILMISTVRYYSFKEMPFEKQGPRFALLAVGLLIGAVYFYSEEVLLALAVVYVASGPVAKLLPLARAVRRAVSGELPSSTPVHGNIKT